MSKGTPRSHTSGGGDMGVSAALLNSYTGRVPCVGFRSRRGDGQRHTADPPERGRTEGHAELEEVWALSLDPFRVKEGILLRR